MKEKEKEWRRKTCGCVNCPLFPAEFMAANGGSMELRVTQDARTGGKQLSMGLKAAYNTGDIGEPGDRFQVRGERFERKPRGNIFT